MPKYDKIPELENESAEKLSKVLSIQNWHWMLKGLSPVTGSSRHSVKLHSLALIPQKWKKYQLCNIGFVVHSPEQMTCNGLQ